MALGFRKFSPGTLCRRQIAASAGMVPLNRDAGRMRGQGAIWGGRADMRRTLYMATPRRRTPQRGLKLFY